MAFSLFTNYFVAEISEGENANITPQLLIISYYSDKVNSFYIFFDNFQCFLYENEPGVTRLAVEGTGQGASPGG